MIDRSKWFVFKKNDHVFGCFRIKPITDPNFDKAFKLFSMKKSIIKMSEMQIAKEFTKIIATHLVQDWENIELIETGGKTSDQETRYSPNTAYQLLMFGDIGSQITSWLLEKSKSIE